jgi:hypothetical protein
MYLDVSFKYFENSKALATDAFHHNLESDEDNELSIWEIGIG